MTLTLHGATLVIYLATNVFRTYITYCAMQIFFDRPPIRRGWALFSYLLYGVGISLVYLFFNIPALTFGANVVLKLLITLSYQGSWQRRIAAVAFNYILVLLSEVIVLVLMEAAGTAHFTRFDDQEFILAQIAVCLVNYIIVALIKRAGIIKGHDQIQPIPWAAVIAVPVCTALPIITLVLIGSEPELPIIALAIVGLFAINILVFYLYEHIARLYQTKLALQLTAQQAEAYQQQAELYRQQQEEVRQLRHDLKNHFIALEAFARQSQNEAATAYAADLKQKAAVIPDGVATGIIAVDAIINYKIAQAKLQAIEVETELYLPARLQIISDADLCAVLGNLLDNAIRAAAELPADERWLRLTMTYRKSVLSIQVVNPYTGSLRQKHGRLLTTKPQEAQHGIGLQSVKHIADKYGGQLEIDHQQQIFTAAVWLSDVAWQ